MNCNNPVPACLAMLAPGAASADQGLDGLIEAAGGRDRLLDLGAVALLVMPARGSI